MERLDKMPEKPLILTICESGGTGRRAGLRTAPERFLMNWPLAWISA